MADTNIRVHVIPVLSDNYSYLIEDGESAFVVDPPEVEPVQQALGRLGVGLRGILVTHKHGDHVAGVQTLASLWHRRAVAAQHVVVYGPAEDGEIAGVTDLVMDGDKIDVLGCSVRILALAGHTRGHIAYDCVDWQMLFCGDCLFSMGCGRVFEGSYAQMWQSLLRLRQLADSYRVYCGHEYTLTNGAFALQHDGANAALRAWVDEAKTLRAQDKPTVPLLLGREKRINPFLRADDANLQKAIGMQGQDAVQVFGWLREQRNRF